VASYRDEEQLRCLASDADRLQTVRTSTFGYEDFPIGEIPPVDQAIF
jgi:hypothetical protein